MMRMTEAEYDALLARQKQAGNVVNKPVSPTLPSGQARYRNEPVIVDGVRYASKKQYTRWCQLQMLEKAGKVSNLRREVPFVIAPAVTINGRNKPPLRYYADAVYVENGREVVEDTKSPVTRKDSLYRAKIHLLKAVLGIDVFET